MLLKNTKLDNSASKLNFEKDLNHLNSKIDHSLTSDEKSMMLLSYSPSSLRAFTILPMAMSRPVTMAEKILLSYIPGLSFSDPGYWEIQIQD